MAKLYAVAGSKKKNGNVFMRSNLYKKKLSAKHQVKHLHKLGYHVITKTFTAKTKRKSRKSRKK